MHVRELVCARACKFQYVCKTGLTLRLQVGQESGLGRDNCPRIWQLGMFAKRENNVV